MKTIRDLTALVRELNQLAKCDREDRTESLRVQWGRRRSSGASEYPPYRGTQ
ncbi:MAG: hypothetical protein ACLUNQ_04505 [Oscillospiraceae bacterium]